jgi:hypothetical protein
LFRGFARLPQILESSGKWCNLVTREPDRNQKINSKAPNPRSGRSTHASPIQVLPSVQAILFTPQHVLSNTVHVHLPMRLLHERMLPCLLPQTMYLV